MNVVRSIVRNLLNPTGLTDARKIYYRTRDNRADYGFSFEMQSDGAWRVFIESQPGYRGRPSDCHSTHRLSDGWRSYVCWNSPIRSYQEAKSIAALWAEKTQEYIRTGRPF